MIMGKLKSKFIEEKVFVGLMWIAVAVVLLVVIVNIIQTVGSTIAVHSDKRLRK